VSARRLSLGRADSTSVRPITEARIDAAVVQSSTATYDTSPADVLASRAMMIVTYIGNGAVAGPSRPSATGRNRGRYRVPHHARSPKRTSECLRPVALRVIDRGRDAQPVVLAELLQFGAAVIRILRQPGQPVE
jgi:hypothetical protein